MRMSDYAMGEGDIWEELPGVNDDAKAGANKASGDFVSSIHEGNLAQVAETLYTVWASLGGGEDVPWVDVSEEEVFRWQKVGESAIVMLMHQMDHYLRGMQETYVVVEDGEEVERTLLNLFPEDDEG